MLSWIHVCWVLITGPWSHTGAKDVHLLCLGMCSPLPWQFKLKRFKRSQMNPEPGVRERLRLLRDCKIFPVGQIQYIAHFKIKFYWYTAQPHLIFSRAVFMQQWENWGLATKLYFLALCRKFTDFWIPTTVGKLSLSQRSQEGQQIVPVCKVVQPSSNSGLQVVKAHSAHLSEPF